MSTNKRAAEAWRVREAEALLDRRYFSLDPERWAAFQAVLDAPARPNPRLKKLLHFDLRLSLELALFVSGRGCWAL